MKNSVILSLLSIFVSIFSLSQFIVWGIDWLREGFSWGTVPYVWIVLYLLARKIMSDKKENIISYISGEISIILFCFGIAAIIVKNWFIAGILIVIPILLGILSFLSAKYSKRKAEREKAKLLRKALLEAKDKITPIKDELNQSIKRLEEVKKGFDILDAKLINPPISFTMTFLLELFDAHTFGGNNNIFHNGEYEINILKVSGCKVVCWMPHKYVISKECLKYFESQGVSDVFNDISISFHFRDDVISKISTLGNPVPVDFNNTAIIEYMNNIRSSVKMEPVESFDDIISKFLCITYYLNTTRTSLNNWEKVILEELEKINKSLSGIDKNLAEIEKIIK